MENNKCQTGCKFYTGGEIKHHKDCFYYPDSMSKIFDDMKAELKKLRVGDVIKNEVSVCDYEYHGENINLNGYCPSCERIG